MYPESHWNYRVVQTTENDEQLWGIYEVHYQNGTPVARTVEPIGFVSEEGVAGVAESLRRALRATEEPVLTDDDFGIRS